MKFGKILKELKNGKKAYRAGWNGKDQYIFLINGSCLRKSICECYGNNNLETFPVVSDTIAFKTAQNTITVGWLASQVDMLAEDWNIKED